MKIKVIPSRYKAVGISSSESSQWLGISREGISDAYGYRETVVMVQMQSGYQATKSSGGSNCCRALHVGVVGDKHGYISIQQDTTDQSYVNI